MDDQELELSELYQTYFRAICLYVQARLPCDRYRAEDIASDVFFILQLKWNTIHPRTPAVLITWLYRTADNLLRDHRKRAMHSPDVVELESAESMLFAHGSDEIDIMLQKEDFRRLLHTIKAALSKGDWALFVAKYIEEKTTAEMLAQFGLQPGTFYLRCSRLRGRLKKIVKGARGDA